MGNLTDSNTEVAAAFEAGGRAVEATKRLAEWEGIPYVIESPGKLLVGHDLVNARDARGQGPLRRRGAAQLQELGSFIDYVNRWKAPETVVYANTAALVLTAVIDAHPEGSDHGATRWEGFRAGYACPRSPEWIFWTGIEGKQFKQEAFADIIDARLDDLASAPSMPSPMDMLEMARNLQIRIVGEHRRRIDPTTGTGELVTKTEHTTESTRIPRAFRLGLRVFDGGQLVAVEARLRFALENGVALFSVTLHRRQEIEREAFDEVRRRVIADCALPVFAGIAP